MENPTTDRSEAAKKAIEAAGGKLISFYATPAEGPGVLVILDSAAGRRDGSSACAKKSCSTLKHMGMCKHARQGIERRV